jgi:enoyl-CoA hydratase/carnithine racemase
MGDSELVLVKNRGTVRHLVLNRPDRRNAFNLDLIEAIAANLRAAAADDDVRCVIVRGAGPSFSAGLDTDLIREFAESPAGLSAFSRACLAAWTLASEMPKPTICQIHGACVGGATALALACDLRVIADDARIGMPEARAGLIPDAGGVSRLARLIGAARAKELVMTAAMISADEAIRIGLANRVAPAAELDAATAALAEELLACAPLAIGLVKGVIDAAAGSGRATAIELERAVQERLVRSQDFVAAEQALRERRKPVFRGQ